MEIVCNLIFTIMVIVTLAFVESDIEKTILNAKIECVVEK